MLKIATCGSCGLEELGVPYEIVGVDHPNHDLDSPAYRALNPFGQLKRC